MADPVTEVIAGGGIVGTVLGLAYKIWRLFKNDRREDKKDNWTELLLQRVQLLEKRVDVMEKERNEALEKAIQLEGEVERLRIQLEKIEAEYSQVKIENEILKARRPRRVTT